MIYNSEMMRNLMLDLLDLAQMEKSTFKLNKEFFSVPDTVKKSFGILQHIAERKNVKLEIAEIPK